MKTNDAFVLRNIYGKYILMPIRSNTTSNDPILLNEVAGSIWNEALVCTDIKQIILNIADSYKLIENSPEWIAVEQFVDQMVNMGLLITS